MKASQTLIEKIKHFEGFRAEAYRCPAGQWTVGYGHTRGVYEGRRVTRAEADRLLREDLAPLEHYVTGLGLSLTQGQTDALLDFCFNLGTPALDGSTLLRKIRAGTPTAEIQKEFRRWVYAGGEVLPGLVTRREWEAERWAQ